MRSALNTAANELTDNAFTLGGETAQTNENTATESGGERYSKYLKPGWTFPPYNQSQSDANEQATRWAHRDDVESGDRKLVSYHGAWYVIEKFDSAELGYQIAERLTAKQYERYMEERQYGKEAE